MDCKQLTALLDEFLDRQLDGAEMNLCTTHLQACKACQARVAVEQGLREALRNLPVTRPRRGFARKALLVARRAHGRDQRLSFARGFATAMVCAVAMLAVVSWWPQRTPVAPMVANLPATTVPAVTAVPVDLQAVHVSLHERQDVRLVFNVPRDLEQVTLRVELPNHVVLARGKPKHQIEWQTTLSKGSNVLTLPLTAVEYGEGELSAVLVHQGGQKAFRLRLVTSRTDASLPPAFNVLHI